MCLVSIPQAVGTIAINKVVTTSNRSAEVSIPQAVGTIAIFMCFLTDLVA